MDLEDLGLDLALGDSIAPPAAVARSEPVAVDNVLLVLLAAPQRPHKLDVAVAAVPQESGTRMKQLDESHP